MQPLNLKSPAVLLRFAAELRTQVEDLYGAAEDATRSPGKRTLGRAEARRIATEAHASIVQMIDAMLLGLGETPPVGDEPILPAGEYEGPPSAPRPR
jgi:hypothetical protein